MKIAVIFFLLACSCAAQMVSAPQPQQPVCQNGKPYLTGKVAFLVGSCPYDKPKVEPWDGKKDHFFTFGNGERALHPDKKSWVIFTAVHAGLWASTVMAVKNKNASHEEAHSEYPAVIFMTGMDTFFFKTVSPAIPTGIAIFGITHYSIAAAK